MEKIKLNSGTLNLLELAPATLEGVVEVLERNYIEPDSEIYNRMAQIRVGKWHEEYNFKDFEEGAKYLQKARELDQVNALYLEAADEVPKTHYSDKNNSKGEKTRVKNSYPHSKADILKNLWGILGNSERDKDKFLRKDIESQVDYLYCEVKNWYLAAGFAFKSGDIEKGYGYKLNEIKESISKRLNRNEIIEKEIAKAEGKLNLEEVDKHWSRENGDSHCLLYEFWYMRESIEKGHISDKLKSEFKKIYPEAIEAAMPSLKHEIAPLIRVMESARQGHLIHSSTSIYFEDIYKKLEMVTDDYLRWGLDSEVMFILPYAQKAGDYYEAFWKHYANINDNVKYPTRVSEYITSVKQKLTIPLAQRNWLFENR